MTPNDFEPSTSPWDCWLREEIEREITRPHTPSRYDSPYSVQLREKQKEIRHRYNPYQIIPMQAFGFSREENVENAPFYPKPIPIPTHSGNWNPTHHFNPKEGQHD